MNADVTRVRMPKLMERLPEAEREVALRLTEEFQAAGEELYLVGGVVRDLLLGRRRADLDFATSAAPETTKELGRRAGADAMYDIGAAFGTIGLVFHRDDAAITTELTT